MPKIATHCKGCNEELTPLNAVYRGFRRLSRCKECMKIYNREYHKQRLADDPNYNSLANNQPSRTPEARKAQYINWKYGLSIEEYNQKLELQLGGCAICKQPCPTGRQLAIDHDHKTGIIRDLLCIKCNNLLGLINDDEEILWKMLEYLKRHNTEKAS